MRRRGLGSLMVLGLSFGAGLLILYAVHTGTGLAASAAQTTATPRQPMHALAYTPSLISGAYNCAATQSYPDTQPVPTNMCAEILPGKTTVQALVSAPAGWLCQASIAYWPPLQPVALHPAGDRLRWVGTSSILRYQFKPANYPHHGDHLFLTTECGARSATTYDVRNVVYVTGSTIPSAVSIASSLATAPLASTGTPTATSEHQSGSTPTAIPTRAATVTATATHK